MDARISTHLAGFRDRSACVWRYFESPRDAQHHKPRPLPPTLSSKRIRGIDSFLVASTVHMPSHEDIERRAFELWEQRGRPSGTPEIDWFEAEHEASQIQLDGVLLRVAHEVGKGLGKGVAFLKELHPTKG
jgi:Protein of unknown function (DUF2934)